MTNRQSNIIFYCVISIIVYVIIVNNFYPDFFEDFTKSKTELSIKEAESKGEHSKALMMYQDLVREKVGLVIKKNQLQQSHQQIWHPVFPVFQKLKKVPVFQM